MSNLTPFSTLGVPAPKAKMPRIQTKRNARIMGLVACSLSVAFAVSGVKSSEDPTVAEEELDAAPGEECDQESEGCHDSLAVVPILTRTGCVSSKGCLVQVWHLLLDDVLDAVGDQSMLELSLRAAADLAVMDK